MNATMISRILPLLIIPLALTAAPTEKVRNPHAVVFEDSLAPGQSLAVRTDLPSVTVYCQPGAIEIAAAGEKAQTAMVQSGEAIFLLPAARTFKNVGNAPLRIVRVDLPGQGVAETWGSTGIPHYKLLLENRLVRVYDIRVAAGATEPQHTHKDRVVVCLSGADLIHTMPDGRAEPATLKTGEIAWRLGATHVGHNIGKTDLWVIAIEPK
jgi:quercetin dioxygenase-like cupin family protein